MTRFRLHGSPCQSLSLIDLVARIVNYHDRSALEEVLNRRIFHSPERSRLRLPEFLQYLRSWAYQGSWGARRAYEAADKAYDITLDKFSNLPISNGSDEDSPSPKPLEVKQFGPDCRYYYQAFRENRARDIKTRPPQGELESETRAAAAMQRFVKRHFYLSLLEAKRSTNEFWSRYNWRIDDQTICVWLPTFLKGTERRKWLEKNIKDPDPARPGERERIQSIIGRRLASMVLIPYHDQIALEETDSADNQGTRGMEFGFSLAQFVAKEKSCDINNQRRSIKQLGRNNLRQLIIRIFEDLDAGVYQDNRIAKDFGLSKATFSRFAGSRWQRTPNRTIPDLWLNTAQVLSTHPEFKAAAIQAGVWEQVEEAVNLASTHS